MLPHPWNPQSNGGAQALGSLGLSEGREREGDTVYFDFVFSSTATFTALYLGVGTVCLLNSFHVVKKEVGELTWAW